MENRQLPPQSLESEMAVLGAILLDNNCFLKVKTLLSEDDFYRESHRVIYNACYNLHVTHQPIDTITLSNRLKETGNLEECGGAPYLMNLWDFTPTAANVAHYCKAVKNKAIRRRMITSARELMDSAYQDGCDVQQALTDAKESLSLVAGDAHGSTSSDIRTLEERTASYIKYVTKVGSLRFRTGLGEIDNAIRGVAPGEVLTIIAYSGTYKSALLQNLLNGAAARSGLYQMFFSMEMPEQKLFEREIQMQYGITGREVEELFKTDAWKLNYKHLYDKNSHKVLTCEKSRLTVAKIASYIEMARYKHGEIGGVGIDYLGLMKAEGKSIFDKVSALSADLKGMAKDCHVPVIVLCQVNRGYAASKNIEIEMDAAKGGGDIEAGADFMLGLWKDNDVLCAKLLKNRNGPANLKWELEIEPSTLRFLSTKPFRQGTTSTVNQDIPPNF